MLSLNDAVFSVVNKKNAIIIFAVSQSIVNDTRRVCIVRKLHPSQYRDYNVTTSSLWTHLHAAILFWSFEFSK